MLRNHDIDHETGLVFEGLAMHGLPRKSYGYMRVAKVVDGFFPPTGKPERVYLCHITRGEALQQIREVLAPALATAQVA